MSTPAAASKSKTSYTKGNLYQIPCTDLQADPNQPRKYFDEVALDELANSITTHGILQPVLFREDMDGKLIIVAGERRLKATTKAGLKTIPAILSDGNPDEVALVENIIREDLTAIDHAEAVNRLMEVHSYTQEQVGIFMRKAKSTVNDILQLVKLPQEIKDECRNDPKISRQVLLNIARKKKEKGMVTAYKKYKANKTIPQKTRGRKSGGTFETRCTTKFDSIKTFMTGIDLGKLDDGNRKKLSMIIENLKKAADDYLKIIQKAPAYVKVEKPAVKEKRVAKPKAIVKPKLERKPKQESAKKSAVKSVAKSKGK